MRMLQLHAGYRTPAGEDTVVESEASTLREAGHTVRQHIVANPSRLGPAIRALAVSAHNRNAAAGVRQTIERFRPDVVHVHNTWFALSPAVVSAAVATGVPVVATVHNYRLGCLSADLFRGADVCTACVGRAPLAGVWHGCYRGSRVLSAVAAVEVLTERRQGALDGVARFVAPSRFMADRLVEIGLPEDRLVVKPHFVDDPGPRVQPPSRSREVLYIGRLAPGKGLPTLLRAWERYSAATDEAPMDLVVIGDGPLGPELRESAPRGVRFEGWLRREDVVGRMLRARAFVFPSEWYEPFGMVLVEALSAGLPIVVTNASDARRIADAPDALVVPAADDEALAHALAALTDGLVDRVGAAGRARFEQHYTRAAGLAALEQLYDDVLAERAT